MKNVMKIINRLQECKTNEAIKILRENKENEKLKYILDFVFNPFIVTGISDKKYNKKIKTQNDSPMIKFSSFINLLEYIKANNTGKDEVLLNVRNYCIGKPEDVKDFIESVITKSLKIGLNAIGINKAFDMEFIPRFCVQLAYNFCEFEDDLYESGKDFTLTLKLDGQRCIALKHNGIVTLFSRTGKIIDGCVDIERELNKLNYDNYMIDGEILAQMEETSNSKDRYKKTMEIMRTNGIKTGLQFFAFDCTSYDDFVNKTNAESYLQRRNNLSNILSGCTARSCITFLPNYYCGNDYNMIDSILQMVIAKNLEGIMLNINSAPYIFQRADTLLKIKLMQDIELKVIGVKEGKGKDKGKLGSVICLYKGKELSVGSGFTKYLRERYWKRQDLIIGKEITVQYFEETEDSDGNPSLRFPVFKDIRYEE